MHGKNKLGKNAQLSTSLQTALDGGDPTLSGVLTEVNTASEATASEAAEASKAVAVEMTAENSEKDEKEKVRGMQTCSMHVAAPRCVHALRAAIAPCTRCMGELLGSEPEVSSYTLRL